MTTVDLQIGPVVEPRLDAVRVELARLVNAARAGLLGSQTAVSVLELAVGRGSTVDAARQWVTRQRAKGALVTVSHEGLLLFPTFQLDTAFDLDHLAAQVVQRLGQEGMDAWAIWDVAAQDWVIDTLFDHIHCHHCLGPTRAEQVVLTSSITFAAPDRMEDAPP